MKPRKKIKELIEEYEKLLNDVVDGNASAKQQDNIINVINEIRFYTNRVMLFEPKET